MTDKFREALFNEIKGSLFEYVTALELAKRSGLELAFLKSLPPHYQQVLEQQDHMTREVYPELLPHLPLWAKQVADAWQARFPQPIGRVQLTGQLIHTEAGSEQGEADFTVDQRAVSLKLNKRQGAVNTKSGGIKSFFTTYFPSEQSRGWQERFNQLVDGEFAVVRHELHHMAGLADDGAWNNWRRAGLSELPGEVPSDMRERLHAFYARVALGVREGLEQVALHDAVAFREGVMRLCGVGESQLVQVICFHDLHGSRPEQVDVRIYEQAQILAQVSQLEWRPQQETASCEFSLADWQLQIRVKPMNKFTTTAIKMNCSVRY